MCDACAAFMDHHIQVPHDFTKRLFEINRLHFFGIKADKEWMDRITNPDQQIQFIRTREVCKQNQASSILGPSDKLVSYTDNGNGTWDVMIDAAFRKYDSAEESFEDHANFLVLNSNYAPAFKTTNGKDFAMAVAAGGYATDPGYGKLLCEIIDGSGLEEWDELG